LVDPARGNAAVELGMVGARDPERARLFAQAHGFGAAGDYEAAVADPSADIIYISLPVSEHAFWAIRALREGKHVLCEKPFAMNLKEAATVLHEAARAGRRVFEAFHYRYHPDFERVLDWIAAGRIGSVRELWGEFHAPISARGGAEIRHRPECGGGAFMDLGCYPLSWALTLMESDPVAVVADADLTPLGVDKRMDATLSFGCGARAFLSSSMAIETTLKATLRIEGTLGVIEYDNPVAPHLGAARLSLQAGADAESASIASVSTYACQLAAIVGAIQSGMPLPTENVAILRQQRALDAVYGAAGLAGLRSRDG
jgi:predicted dehydrogenase